MIENICGSIMAKMKEILKDKPEFKPDLSKYVLITGLPKVE